MYVFDVESLDLESTTVILSIGAVYHDGVSPISYQNLIDTGILIKFDARDQIANYKRTKSRSTLEWWDKQSEEAKRASLLPTTADLDAVTGLNAFNKWFSKFPDYKNEIVWARGSLDQLSMESLYRATGVAPSVPHSSWRDIRTGIELLYEKTRNGYVDVDPDKVLDYTRTNVIRHNPLHDCAEDMCMLIGGKSVG